MVRRVFIVAAVCLLNSCSLKQGQVLPKQTESGEEWFVLGPFPLVPRERGASSVHMREAELSPNRETYFSEFHPQGKTHWRTLSSSASQIVDHFSVPNSELFIQEHGRAGLMSLTYFYREIIAAEDEVKILKLMQVPEFYLNGKLWFGESYDYEGKKLAVPFKKGVNRLLLKVPSFGSARFSFAIQSAASPVSISAPLTIPHIVSCPADYWIGVPLLNQTNQWLRGVGIEQVSGPGNVKMESLDLPPLSVQIARIRWSCEIEASSYRVEFVVKSKEQELHRSHLNFEGRPQTDEHIRTFVSQHDESVQYYALRPAVESSEAGEGLLVALHGANVEAAAVPATYAPRKDVTLVAPTNRGRHGFAWQSLGRLDAMEVIDEVMRLRRIDRRRIFLAGHSMGGQGVWHLGVNYPDLFAGLIPAAAWSSFDRYLPDFLGLSALEMEPGMDAIFNRVAASKDHLRFLRNLADVPVLGLQATRDAVVPAYHQRLYQKLLRRFQTKMNLLEISSGDHWCKEAPGIQTKGYACVDPQEAEDFVQAVKKTEWPRTLNLRFSDLSSSSRFYWIEVLSQERVFSDSTLVADYGDSEINLSTTNIESLSVRVIPGTKPQAIRWNGRRFPIESGASVISLGKQNSRRTYRFYGGVEAILTKPGVILFADSEDLHNAILFNHLYNRVANASIPMLPIDSIKDRDLREKNLIVFGSASHPLVKRWLNRLPFSFENQKVSFGRESVSGTLGFVSAFPHPLNETRMMLLFVDGGPEMKRDMLFMRPFAGRSGLQLPDFMIFDSSVSERGMAGVRLAGFYSNQWDLRNADFEFNRAP